MPRTDWGADWAPVPNRITLFRLPLEADFADPDELEDEVWITVVHELAHHLGIDDDQAPRAGRRLRLSAARRTATRASIAQPMPIIVRIPNPNSRKGLPARGRSGAWSPPGRT